VVAQVALAVMVVMAAGLLTRSLLRLQAVDMGLAADRLVLVFLAVPKAKYPDGTPHVQFLRDVVAGLEAVPGIERATPVHSPPFAGTHGWDAPEFTAEGQDAERAAANPSLNLESIHPNYFETLGVTLVRGRGFTEADGRGAPEVAIVSEDVAERTWPRGDPIGKRLKLGGPDSKEPWRNVIGVAGPTRYPSSGRPADCTFPPRSSSTRPELVVRTSSPLAVAPLVRERCAIDPDVPVFRCPFAELVRGPLARPRFNALLIGLFGVAALLLAAVGLFAVMAASVRLRHRELALRLARRGHQTCAASCSVRATAGRSRSAIGIGLAAVATGLLRRALLDVPPFDPVTLVVAALVALAASGVACYLPARVASRADPAALLRAE
jgi:hypothetical protein